MSPGSCPAPLVLPAAHSIKPHITTVNNNTGPSTLNALRPYALQSIPFEYGTCSVGIRFRCRFGTSFRLAIFCVRLVSVAEMKMPSLVPRSTRQTRHGAAAAWVAKSRQREIYSRICCASRESGPAIPIMQKPDGLNNGSVTKRHASSIKTSRHNFYSRRNTNTKSIAFYSIKPLPVGTYIQC